jgi:hypothetical protein
LLARPPASVVNVDRGARNQQAAAAVQISRFLTAVLPGTALFDIGTKWEGACGREAARVRRRNQIAGTLEAIDEEAAAHGLTRSAFFIASAAMEKIRRRT